MIPIDKYIEGNGKDWWSSRPSEEELSTEHWIKGCVRIGEYTKENPVIKNSGKKKRKNRRETLCQKTKFNL